jgi:ring-1,2-phenylacetyl-CoA epoxidase subunit PaaC
MTEKTSYILHLADNALITGHRNSEWCGRGPALEQDIALTNLALDLIGQARNFYQYAADLLHQEGDTEVSEDSLAYLRDVREFKNCLLAEQPKGDWAVTIVRQFLFSTYQYYFFQLLQESSDAQLSGIAEKSLKEVRYHLKWSSEWVIRLGDGTELSHQKMVRALDELWGFTGELLEPSGYETSMIAQGIGADLSLLKNDFLDHTSRVLGEAGLQAPASAGLLTGGKNGLHTEYLGHLLAEMQFLQRAYPQSSW